MTTSSSAMADSLVTMLSATSVLGAGNVSKAGYAALESSASAAAMVKWVNFRLEQSNFGIAYRELWDFQVRCFIRDTGDPNLASNRVWTVTDKVLACVRADPTLLGVVDDIAYINGANNPEEVLTVGGATWLPFTMVVQAIIL